MSLITSMDLSILNSIATHFHSGLLNILMPVITSIGQIIWVILAAFLTYRKKYRLIGLEMFLAILIGFIICNLGIKPLVERPRPFTLEAVQLLVKAPKDYSFPSGHTLMCFESAMVLFLNRFPHWQAAFVLACTVAFSRLYLFVHFPTDVLTGAVLGLLFGCISVAIGRTLQQRYGTVSSKNAVHPPRRSCIERNSDI